MAELELAGFHVMPPNVRGPVPEIGIDQSSLDDKEILELIRGLGIIGRHYWGTIVHLDNLRQRDVERVVREIKAIRPACEIDR